MEREMYRDCMRNHAATLGTYATDGCGEFTPDLASPGGLRCAACGCHRNFHRKVPIPSPALDGNGDSLIMGYSPYSASAEASEGRKRTRTKFTPEQKEEMLRFAEEIGWRIPRKDGSGGVDEVGRFCREIGVSRQIFKVWMHNHKSSTASSSIMGGTAIIVTDDGIEGAGGSMEE